MNRSRLFAPSAEAAACEPNRSTKYSCAGICKAVSQLDISTICHMNVRQERQLRANAYYYKEGAEADENSPNDGHDPVHLVEGGPPIHEEPETHKGAEENHHYQVILGLRGCDPVGPHARPLHAAVQAVEGDQGEHERDAGAQVHEPGH